MKCESLSALDIAGRAVVGLPLTLKETLSIYADEKNWLGEYPDSDCVRGKIWTWRGPVLPPWELAQNAIDEGGRA